MNTDTLPMLAPCEKCGGHDLIFPVTEAGKPNPKNDMHSCIGEVGYDGPSDPFERQVGGTCYMDMEIQPGVFSERNMLSYFEGSIVKRICSYHYDHDPEELRKIIHECELLLKINASSGQGGSSSGG